VAHQHYKGTGQMHSFRGLLEHSKQEKIRIQGPVGDIAWRITKFEILGKEPFSAGTVKYVMKVYRESQSTLDDSIDFTDSELLGAAVYMESVAQLSTGTTTVIFDNALFSRDIYVTHYDTSANQSCNYYIELEEVKVSAAGMAQLAVGAARRNRFTSE